MNSPPKVVIWLRKEAAEADWSQSVVKGERFGGDPCYEPVMESLAVNLHRLAKTPSRGWSWAGPNVAANESVISATAARIGLDARGRENEFFSLPATDAATWIALFAGHSLLHGVNRDISALIETVEPHLAALADDFVFVSKGRWSYTRRGNIYRPVTSDREWSRRRHALSFHDSLQPLAPIDVLVDGGVIGFNAEHAFIFWVAEDD